MSNFADTKYTEKAYADNTTQTRTFVDQRKSDTEPKHTGKVFLFLIFFTRWKS